MTIKSWLKIVFFIILFLGLQSPVLAGGLNHTDPPLENALNRRLSPCLGLAKGTTELEIRLYLGCAAPVAGIDLATVIHIVKKESGFNPSAIGDHGKSVGLWQFNLKANPQVSRKCALDIICSTQTALEWIKAGKILKWSTWRNKNLLSKK